MRIGIDLIGGECPPDAIFDVVCQLAKEGLNADHLVVFAQEGTELAVPPSNVEVCQVPHGVSEEESPLLAVRRKKRSSLAVGIHQLREKKLDAFVSAGNTGALIATASLYLPKLPSCLRIALLATFPALQADVAVLDVGAHIASSPKHLVSYAKLGCAYLKALKESPSLKVGLLNIGTEAQKGTALAKGAYHALNNAFENAPGITFLGNIEGREAFSGKVDVLVTDGFTGNVFLKTAEGISSFMLDTLKTHNITNASSLIKTFNYSEHPGALLAGVDGLIVKCHGYSNPSALRNGILGAVDLANKGVIPKMRKELQSY